MSMSGLVGTRTTGFELAIVAFEYEPVRARLTHAAIPEDEGRVGFDDGEGVRALCRVGHWLCVVFPGGEREKRSRLVCWGQIWKVMTLD